MHHKTAAWVATWVLLLLVLDLLHLSLYTHAQAKANELSLEQEVQFSKIKYFYLMRKYFGDEQFEQNRCLVQQEKYGWRAGADMFPTSVFNLGVEGTGHHAIETLLDNGMQATGSVVQDYGFSTLRNNGGQFSIPTGWRRQYPTKNTKRYSHPDIADMVRSKKFIIVLLRYPPSALISSLDRFQNRSQEHARSGSDIVTATDEVYTLFDSLVMLSSVLNFPKLDCDRILFVPFEVWVDVPMAIFGPMAEALHINQSKPHNLGYLKQRFENFKEYQQTKASALSRYFIKEQVCSQLNIDAAGNGAITDHTYKRRIRNLRRDHRFGKLRQHPVSRATSNVEVSSNDCAQRLYKFARDFFDSRSFQYENIYPSAELIAASAKDVDHGLNISAV